MLWHSEPLSAYTGTRRTLWSNISFHVKYRVLMLSYQPWASKQGHQKTSCDLQLNMANLKSCSCHGCHGLTASHCRSGEGLFLLFDIAALHPSPAKAEKIWHLWTTRDPQYGKLINYLRKRLVGLVADGHYNIIATIRADECHVTTYYNMFSAKCWHMMLNESVLCPLQVHEWWCSTLLLDLLYVMSIQWCMLIHDSRQYWWRFFSAPTTRPSRLSAHSYAEWKD